MSRYQNGFSLLEVLVAFAVLAAALGLLLGAMSQSSRQVRHGEDVGRARLHAQSLLAGLGIDQSLEKGIRQGHWDEDRYRWQLQLRPWDGASHAQLEQGLIHYRLEVRWGEQAGERMVVEGLRLKAVGKGEP